jgi:hypothetical protein
MATIAELSWDDVASGNFPQTESPARKAFREAVTETLGSAISISPLYSMNSNGIDAKFSKALSNDFNRLGGKWANRRL